MQMMQPTTDPPVRLRTPWPEKETCQKTNRPRKKLKFKREKSHVFTIVYGDKKEVGRVRVKPSAIGWKTAHDTQWYELTLDEFKALIIERGQKGEIA